MGFKNAITGAVLFGGLAFGTSTFSPARPPAIPLAAKAPYLGTWLQVGSDGGNGGNLAGEWPTFWTGQITGWAGLIRVDGTAYEWMGDVPDTNLVNQTAVSYTSTQSSFIMNVDGLVGLNVTFLSPVLPTDLKRQSLTFSYLNVGVVSLDGNTHDVQLYADVSGEWISGDISQEIQWSYGTADGIAYHQYNRTSQTEISETNDLPNWGNIYWSTADSGNLTFQSGEDIVVRGNFMSNGTLPNTQDSDFRAINDDWPVFGFAQDLGSVGSSTVDTLFTIGLTQVNAIQLLGVGPNLTTYQSYWTNYFDTDVDAMTFFYNDYSTAAGLSATFDAQVQSDSVAAAGQDYATITTLSVRQAFAALQFVGTEDSPLVFLKEISSDGDIQTVDVIFPAMPIILYTNPQLLSYLLDPLYLNQENGHYPKTNAIHDLGHFPLAEGYPAGNDEPQPLEECGNMVVMTLAYAQRTGDNDYLSQHYPILTQWAGYLVNESLIPANQISTDDFAGSLANQTDLALKGIIALRAMADIANLSGNAADVDYYMNVSTSYLSQWQGFGTNSAADPPHTELSYGNATSWGLLYNMYANSILGYKGDNAFVPESVYTMQSNFYPTVALEYCVPLDTRHVYGKTDWSMWAASIASDTTRDLLIGKLANWINATPTSGPFSDLIDCNTGDYAVGITFKARPVVGGHFALLALAATGDEGL
ncbi:glutaminase GtaA [Xylariaceae sp. FL0255]|nr:glutaminase GtaA [Xylariaceae sp. FL0255]